MIIFGAVASERTREAAARVAEGRNWSDIVGISSFEDGFEKHHQRTPALFRCYFFFLLLAARDSGECGRRVNARRK